MQGTGQREQISIFCLNAELEHFNVETCNLERIQKI